MTDIESPKTNWAAGMPIKYSDLNNIGANLNALYNINGDLVAPIETSPAEANHERDNYLIYNNELYKVINTITIGTTLITSGTGQNINKIAGGLSQEITNKISKPSINPNGTNGQLLRTNGDGTMTWVDQGTPTNEQVTAAVDDWLDDHPEATTTVEDGSLTWSKFADGVISFVTPEMYGAAGNGTIDDSPAFQNMVNSGKPIYIPDKTYLITTSLTPPSGNKMYWKGNKDKSVIKLQTTLFNNNITDSTFDSITFSAVSGYEVTAFANNIVRTKINNCIFSSFKRVFSAINTICTISNSYFYGITDYFCSSIIDSDVIGNYINAPKVKNPKTRVVSHTASHAKFIGNFIDYMFAVFDFNSSNAVTSLIVADNQFDLCYNIFRNHIRGVAFTGNTITGLGISNNWDVSDNEEMTNNPWCVINRYTNSAIYDFVASGNVIYDLTKGMYMDCKTTGAPTHDVFISDPVPASMITFKTYKTNNFRDMQNINIIPMKRRTVESLPAATITSSSLNVTYDGDEVIYNGDLYQNIGGEWKKLT